MMNASIFTVTLGLEKTSAKVGLGKPKRLERGGIALIISRIWNGEPAVRGLRTRIGSHLTPGSSVLELFNIILNHVLFSDGLRATLSGRKSPRMDHRFRFLMRHESRKWRMQINI